MKSFFRASIWSPLFLAALICTISATQIHNQILIEETVIGYFLLEVLAVILLFGSWLLTRNLEKASLISCGLLIYLFLYRIIYVFEDVFFKICFGFGKSIPVLLALLIYCGLWFTCAALFGKTSKQLNSDPVTFNQSLCAIFAVLLIFNLIPFAQDARQDFQQSSRWIPYFQAPFRYMKLKASLNRPDIYYIIIDGFASPLALKQLWGFENNDFANFLKKKGFYVVEHANSNYDRTEFSLSSSLNMQYINIISEAMKKDSFEGNVYSRMIFDNVVVHLLKQEGYKFVNVSSSLNDWIYAADYNLQVNPFNSFAITLASLTPLYSIENEAHILRDIIIERRLNGEKMLPQVFSIPGPKFILIHTDVAHAPCIFDENGGRLPIPLPEGLYMRNWGTPEQLFSQWKYAGKIGIKWISTILSQPGPQPIVIVQSDHGSGILYSNPHIWFNERMKILNAYYFPDQHNKGLYPTITPVNSFRVLLNDYFNARLPLLTDHVYCSPNYLRPYDWRDVRSELDY